MLKPLTTETISKHINGGMKGKKLNFVTLVTFFKKKLLVFSNDRLNFL